MAAKTGEGNGNGVCRSWTVKSCESTAKNLDRAGHIFLRTDAAGDIVLPFQPRPIGPFKDPVKFDHFAPVSGKPVAMIVVAKDWVQSSGQRDTFT